MTENILTRYSVLREEQKEVYTKLHSAIESKDYNAAGEYSDEYFRLEKELTNLRMIFSNSMGMRSRNEIMNGMF